MEENKELETVTESQRNAAMCIRDSPYVVQTENGYIICLQDEEGRPYVSVEFLQ